MKKEIIICIRVTHENYQKIVEQAKLKTKTKTGNPNISAFIRNQLLRAADNPDIIQKEIENLIYQMRKIGTNINQVTKKINAEKGSYRDIQMLQREMMTIQDQIDQVLAILRKEQDKHSNHGNYKTDAH